MSTTLYTHILGGNQDQAIANADSILASGILTIDTTGVVDLLESIKLVGNVSAFEIRQSVHWTVEHLLYRELMQRR